MRSKRPGAKTRPSGMATPISFVLPEVGKQLKLDRKVQEWSLFSLWAELVDKRFQTTCRPFKLTQQAGKNHLLVHVNNATIAAELAFYLETYCTVLNRYTPQTGLAIHRIEIRM